MNAGRCIAAGWSITRIVAVSMSPSNTPSAWRKLVSNRDSYDNVRAETINGLYKAEASIGADPGAPSRLSSSRRWNG